MADPLIEKVYCEDCIFYVPGEKIPYSYGPPEHQLEKCLAPQNFKDTNAAPHVLPISQPKVINRFNDCIWFIRKGEPSSSTSSSSSSSSSSL